MKNEKNIKISHRGLYNNIDIPENSLKAFKKSIKEKTPIELDIHILKDNNIVVFHDSNISRMTGIDKDLKDLTYDELKKYKLLNTNEHIPLLKDVLKLVNGKVLLNIELKYSDNYKELCKETSKLLDNYHGKFLIQSFSIKVINWFKQNKKNYKRGLLIPKKMDNKSFLIPIAITLLNLDFISINKHLYNNKNIKKLRDKNFPILLWTITKDEIPKFINDNIIYEKK